MKRPHPFGVVLLALASATVFLAIRLVYRVVFGGAGGSGELLFSVPQFQLWGVFSHIIVGGDVTTGGVLDSLSSGLPFAGVIVVSGLALAWWDPRGVVLLLPRVKVGKQVLIALVIALSMLPVLVRVYRETKVAATRRKVKQGRNLLLPVFEQTLEYATSIHTALRSRGLITLEATPQALTPDSAFSLHGFSWRSRGINDVSEVFEPGSFAVITGQTGAGKTSLLEVIAGLHPEVEQVQPEALTRPPHAEIGYLPHNAKSLFLASTVLDEVALSLVLNGQSRAEAKAHAAEHLGRWGLGHLEGRHPAELSAGEAISVGCAVVTAASPSILLLDEPLRSLDPSSRVDLLTRLDGLSREGVTVVVSDHHSVELDSHGANFYTLDSEGLHPGRYVAPDVELTPMLPRRPTEPDVVASYSDLAVSYGDTRVFDCLSLELRRGHATVISGNNGAGKTSLLDLIASTGPDVAYVPCDPSNFFFTDSVERELALADKAAGAAAGLTATTLRAILSGPWREEIVASMAHTHPRDLSRGQQMALAIAIQMSHRPLALLLDEPTAGLDEAAAEALADVLKCAMETGVALLIATQEPSSLSSLDGQRFQLKAGHLVDDAGVRR